MADNTAKGIVIGRRVLRSTISNSIGKFVTLASYFFLTPFVLHHLGSTENGLWVLVGSALAYGSLLDFGIMAAVIKYVAEFHAQQRADDARNLLSGALKLYSKVGIVAVLLSAALAPLFPRLFDIPSSDRHTAAWLMFLMGVGLGVQFPCLITTAVLRGLQRYDIVSLLSGVATLLYVGSVVLALSLGGGLLYMAAISLGVTVVMQIPAIWFIKKIAPELHVGWQGGGPQWTRKLTSFGSWLFVLDLSNLVRSKTDVMVIGSFLSLRSVTPYGLARKIGESGEIMTDQFMKVILPLASELHAGDDHLRLRSLFLVGTRLTLGIFLPIASVLIVLGRSILTAWVGAEYAASAPLVTLLAFTYLLDVAAWPASNLLQGIGRHRLLAQISFALALLSIPLTIFLTTKYQLVGAAWAALLSTAAFTIGFVLPYSLRHLGIGTRELLKETIVPALIPVFPMLLALYAMKQLLPAASIVSILAISATSALVYGISYLVLGASDLERRTCWSFATDAMRFAEARLRR
jgi:O-antigen/teichoic acid export membrane protein